MYYSEGTSMCVSVQVRTYFRRRCVCVCARARASERKRECGGVCVCVCARIYIFKSVGVRVKRSLQEVLNFIIEIKKNFVALCIIW
jgi:hypothetical protein